MHREAPPHKKPGTHTALLLFNFLTALKGRAFQLSFLIRNHICDAILEKGARRVACLTTPSGLAQRIGSASHCSCVEGGEVTQNRTDEDPTLRGEAIAKLIFWCWESEREKRSWTAWSGENMTSKKEGRCIVLVCCVSMEKKKKGKQGGSSPAVHKECPGRGVEVLRHAAADTWNSICMRPSARSFHWRQR